MLSGEQTARIKEQILKQVENFPEDKRELAKQQIEAMSPEEIEEFIKKNKLVSGQGEQECIFCSINEGKIHSHKLEENKFAIAIFEINPISRGHILIIPKKHEQFKEGVPKRLETFAKKISKKVKTKLKPAKVEIHPANLFGHGILNVLPIYEDENIDSERHKASPEEIEELKKEFEKKSAPRVPKPTKIKAEINEKLWLPKRIP